jgi:hypothetical protein
MKKALPNNQLQSHQAVNWFSTARFTLPPMKLASISVHWRIPLDRFRIQITKNKKDEAPKELRPAKNRS